MNNTDSHSSKKQALQIEAERLLPSITKTLAKLGYQNVVHQRISQHNIDAIAYQGLTRATDDNFGQVMIKWEISADIYYDLMSLGHEIKVLKALDSFQVKAQSFTNIAPQILANKSSIINISEKAYQLTVVVMPYFVQGSLAKHLKQSLTDKQKQQLIVQVAKIISNLHKKRWLHNDIKPSNILVNSNSSTTINDESCRLLLIDFSLATRIDNSVNQKVTFNSAGTPAYLAPERWQGQDATQQSDIYAFGIMMYQILLGKRPFGISSHSHEKLREWAIQHCQTPIPTLPKQYQHYQYLINKTLAKRIENRYQSMDEVLVDLKKYGLKK